MKIHMENENGQSNAFVGGANLTRIEAAAYLRVSVVSIDRAIAKRKISFFRIGRRVLFGEHHLEEFLNRNEYAANVRRGKFNYAV